MAALEDGPRPADRLPQSPAAAKAPAASAASAHGGKNPPAWSESNLPDIIDETVVRTIAIDARKGLLEDPEFRSMCDAGWKLRGYCVRRQYGDALLLDVSFVPGHPA